MKLSASILATQYLLCQDTEQFAPLTNVDGNSFAIFTIVEHGKTTTTLGAMNGHVQIPVLTESLGIVDFDGVKYAAVDLNTHIRTLAGQIREALGETTVEDKLGEIFPEDYGFEAVDKLSAWVFGSLLKEGNDFKTDVTFTFSIEPKEDAPVAAKPKASDNVKAKGADHRRTGSGKEAIGQKVTY